MSQLSLPPFSRRTLLASLGVGAAGLSLAACGAPGGDSDPDSPTREGFGQADADIPSEYSDRTAILFWAPFTGNNFEALQRLLTKFNESQDDIVAVAESQGSYGDLHQKFTAALQAKSVPDIVCFQEMQWMTYYFSNAIAPLDDYFDDDWSMDVYLQNFTTESYADGSVYVIPFARSTPMFYYNKDRYREVGLPEEGPETWDDILEFAPELAKIQVDGQQLSTIAFSMSDIYYSQADLWAFDGAWAMENTVVVNDERGVECFENDRKFIHDDGFGYVTQEPTTDFGAGLTAGARASTASLKAITSEAPFEVGCAFMPGKVNVPTKVPMGGSGLQLVRSDSKERQDACVELFRFLADPENSAQWHADTGYVPIVEAAQETDIVRDLVADDPNYGVALAQLENAQTSDRTSWFPGNVNDAATAVASIQGDNADVQSTLDALAAKMQEVLDDNADAIASVLGE